MPAKRLDQWNEYLAHISSLWDEIGADFKVGDMTRSEFSSLVNEWVSLQTRITEIETQLGILLDQRQSSVKAIQSFGVRFRTAVIAKYGNQHPMVKRVPKLQPTRAPKVPPPTP
ncbi:hypothetical protein [Armatimonas sp.]|uniref:hypothetical protein n=1 Tax=Armatimonas sp. TaxID=1872638 RepID=UPI00286C6DE1|nr:hypothetical protein [Armatimonas sp.]